MISRVVLAAALGFGAFAPVAQQQGARFFSEVEAVRVDVLVTRGGKPFAGLTAADFQIFDNGVEQHIDRIAFEELPLNLVIAVDTSQSVRGERLVHLRAASRSVLGRLKPEDSAALLSFGQDVTIHSRLTRDTARLRGALDSLEPMGDTSLVDAAHAAILLGETQPGRPLVLIFTDGVDASSYLQPAAVLDVVRRSNAVVYAVVARSSMEPRFLRDLSGASGGDLFEIDSTRDLDAAFLHVLGEFRHRYLLSYSPRGVPAAGWHSLQVKVRQRGASVKARAGYTRD